jgi:hypothetical protein
MFTFNDIIMKLPQTPFFRRSLNNKREILNDGRPVILLNNLNFKYFKYKSMFSLF